MTPKGIALVASIIASGAISGMSHAKTAIHEMSAKVERTSSPSQMQNETSSSFASMRSDAPESNTHVYHGGPKSND
jgi:hypothetical protein